MKKNLTIAHGMRNVTLLLLLLMIPVMRLLAGPVSETQARQKARTFLMEHGRKADVLNGRQAVKGHRAPAANANYYVFNLGEADGFVVVSGDDRTTPILGYSDTGNINFDDMPDGLRYLLEGYEQQMEVLASDAYAGDNGNETPRRTDIAPMIKTQWNQGKPYNDLCPLIDGERTVTGCVATSMAQVMNYHKYPTASTTSIPSYSVTTKDKNKASYTLNVAGLKATTFSWNDMLNNYTPMNPTTGKKEVAGTDAQKQAVAKLMQYCGSSIEMVYGLGSNGGSAAYQEVVPYALTTYFGYDGGMYHAYRKNYSYEAWVTMIYNELAASRPVILGGQSCGGGHSFVCDGYKYENESDYFHINWGWGGVSDGFFLLSLLNPDEQGVGGSSTLDGFSFGQDAVVGIRPPVEGNADNVLALDALHFSSPDGALSSKVFTREKASDSFTGINLYFCVWNPNRDNSLFDAQVQLVNADNQLVAQLSTVNDWVLTFSKNYYENTTVTIPSTVKDGTYYIKVKSRIHGNDEWQECYEGDAFKLTATIKDNNLTIDVPIAENVLPASATLEVSGNKRTGSEQTITATITGGSGNYQGDVLLKVNNQYVMGKVVSVPAGETVTVPFSYIPFQAGKNTISLVNQTNETNEKIIGTSEEVDMTLDLKNNGSNTPIVIKSNGVSTDVIMSGRTLYTDGDWNTICLPFDVTDGDDSDGVTFSGTALEGAEARTLVSSSYANGNLTLTFGDPVTTIEAGRAYIIKWKKAADYVDDNAHNIVEPTFSKVTIKSDKDGGFVDAVTDYVDFIGLYRFKTVTDDNHSILFVGAGNTLYWPMEGATLGACRAYFILKNGLTVGDLAGARMLFDEETTEIKFLDDSKDVITPWFSLDGRRLGGKPTQKGLYIHNGKKVVVP